MPILGSAPARRAARWSLLLAALLHLAAGAVGLRAHVALPAVFASAAADPGGAPRDADPRPAPHNEAACVACQSIGGAALPALPASLPAAREVRAISVADPTVLFDLLAVGATRARAPPLA